MSGEIDIPTYMQHNNGMETIHDCSICKCVHNHIRTLCDDFWNKPPFDSIDGAFRNIVTTTPPQRYLIEPKNHFNGSARVCDFTKVPCLSYTVISVTPNITGGAAATEEETRRILHTCPQCNGFLDCFQKRGTRRSAQQEYVVTCEFAHLVDHVRFLYNLHFFLIQKPNSHNLNALTVSARESERVLRHHIQCRSK